MLLVPIVTKVDRFCAVLLLTRGEDSLEGGVVGREPQPHAPERLSGFVHGREHERAATPSSEVLAGLVERVTFHNAENGFCVLRLKARGQRDLITLIGHAATISAGE